MRKDILTMLCLAQQPCRDGLVKRVKHTAALAQHALHKDE